MKIRHLGSKKQAATCILKQSALNLGAKWGWVVKATPRPLYFLEGSVTQCTGGSLGPRADLDGVENLTPTGIRVSSRHTD